MNNELNSIISLDDANQYLMIHYGPNASLELIETKYKFANVPAIRNFKYAFKSVTKAMNCLKMHESGYVAWKIKQRKLKALLNN